MNKITGFFAGLLLVTYATNTMDFETVDLAVIDNLNSKQMGQLVSRGIEELTIRDINVEKILSAITNFAQEQNLPTLSKDNIEERALEILQRLPSHVLNVDLGNLKAGTIDTAIAAQLNRVLPKAHQAVTLARPFFEDPQTGLMLLSQLVTISQSQLADSVKKTLNSVLATLYKLVNSNNPTDQAAVQAIQNIFNRAADIVTTLYNNRNNLVDYNLGTELAQARTTAQANFDAIKNAIELHLPQIQQTLQNARKISLSDLMGLGKTVEGVLKNYGL